MPLLIALLGLVGQGLGPGNPQDFSITIPPAPAKEAIKRIAQKSGEKLAVTSALEDEIVLVRVRNAPLQSTLDYLAKSLCAKWQAQPDGTRYLAPDQTAFKKLLAVEHQQVVGALVRSFAYVQKRLSQQSPDLNEQTVQAYKLKLAAEQAKRKAAEAAEDYNRMFVASSAAEEAPGWRALARLIFLIGGEPLLAMQPESRSVWSDRPTQMQQLLPGDSQSVLAQYRRELALVDPTLNVSRVRVIVQRWETGASYNVNLQSVDPAGKVVDKAFIRMNDDSEKLKLTMAQRELPVVAGDEQPYVLPPDSVEMRKVLSTSDADARRAALLRKWRPAMLDPVHKEPTQWFYGADLIAVADRLDRNLVGTVNDFTTGNYYKPTDQIPSRFLAKSALDFLPDCGSWLVVRPHERTSRYSREQGSRLISNSLAHGGLSVDAAAAWAAQTDNVWPFTNWLGDYMHVLFTARGPYSTLSTMLDQRSLRLWNSLGEGVTTALKEGARLRVADLKPGSKEWIAKLAFWYTGLDDPNLEPTEAFANGIGDGILTMKVAEKPVISGWPSDTPEPLDKMPIDASMLGRSLVSGNSYWQIPAITFQRWDRYRIGVNRSFELKFLLDPGAVPMTITLSETLFDPNGGAVSKLPDNIQAEVRRAIDAERAKPRKAEIRDVIPPR